MAVENVPGHDIRYHLVAFDAQGRERPEDGGLHSRAVLHEAAQTTPTDVFVFSHGWMGDIPAARTQYGRWLAAMASCTADRVAAHELPGGFRPLLLGLHWPSQAWGDEELGAASFDALVGGSAREPVVDGYAPRLADTPATRRALQTIVRAALRDVAPTTLPPEVRQAYEVIDAEAGAGAGRDVAVVVLQQYPGATAALRLLPARRRRRPRQRDDPHHHIGTRPRSTNVLPARRRRPQPGRLPAR